MRKSDFPSSYGTEPFSLQCKRCSSLVNQQHMPSTAKRGALPNEGCACFMRARCKSMRQRTAKLTHSPQQTTMHANHDQAFTAPEERQRSQAHAEPQQQEEGWRAGQL
eukprot:scaffold119783_cov19-Tisochrysis_lutea.AAC.1